MRIVALTDPAAPDRENEDAVAVGPDLAVVVDGAGLRAEMRRGCRHPVAWFSRHLARALALRLEDRRRTMPEALAGAIAAVRDLHAGSCDLEAGSPSGTVAAWRAHEGMLETLVLCDAAILLPGPDGAELVTDLRVHDAVERAARRLAAQEEAAGRPLGDPAIPLRFRALDAARNVPGGFWCAHHDPAAAEHALVRSVPWRTGSVVAAMSDGAARAVLEVGTHTVDELSRACARGRLEELCEQVRRAEVAQRRRYEARGAKVHDDLSLVVGRA